MPELHINGWFPHHNSSLGNYSTEASYDASSSFTVTRRWHNSTIPISIPTNSMDSEKSFGEIVSFILYFWLALVIMIAIGIWLVSKRRIMKTRESQESNEQIEMEPLSPPTSVQTCN